MSTPVTAPPNPDRVTPPVVGVAGIGGTLGLIIAAMIDSGWNPPKSNHWDDILIAVLPMLLAGIGAWVGAQRAKQTVTPVLAGDHPRNLDGELLAPAGHGPSRGYPRTAEEQAEQLQRYRRVDRREIDREPPPGV